jgi:hypothetical protein
VIGAISRKANVVCRAIENTKRETLQKFVKETVSSGVSLLATDEHPAYGRLDPEYPHQTIQHRDNVYVRGEVHINSIVSFWALLKCGVVGTFHNVSAEYLPLPLYLPSSRRPNFRQERDPFALLISRVSQS